MVRLDLSMLRYLSRDDFRVLTALEMGMKNHDLVSTQLINSLASLKRGDAVKAMQQLHRNKLCYHESKPYDGYRLTYHGYDFLAMKTHVKRGNVVSMGSQIGVGKESDVFMGANEEGNALAVKFHRLGRTSFRSIKRNRDYHKGRSHASWLYLSRLAALKEYAYMKVLFENGFPVPTPVDVNRHVIVMEFLKGYTTLYHVHELKHPGRVYNTLMNLLVSLAECGLVHGDFNEFNLMVDANDNVIMIDFPQMISIDHPNAEEIFDRDVQGVRNFFKKRFGFHGSEFPVLGRDTLRKHNLDKEIQASGFSPQLEEEFALLSSENAKAEEDNDISGDASETGEENSNSGSNTHVTSLVTENGGDEDDDDEDDDNDGDDDEDDDHAPQLTKEPSHPSPAPQQDDEDDEDDIRPDESRKERRDRLRREALQRQQMKTASASSSLTPAASSSSSSSTPNSIPSISANAASTDTPNTELDSQIADDDNSDAAIRSRIIKSRVKAQLEKKRIRDRVNARNAFKLQAKRNLAQQTRGWAEDL